MGTGVETVESLIGNGVDFTSSPHYSPAGGYGAAIQKLYYSLVSDLERVCDEPNKMVEGAIFKHLPNSNTIIYV